MATVALYNHPQTFAMKNESQDNKPQADNIPQISQQKTIENDKYIGSGIVGSLIGFGIGHAIQGRYLEKGWIFTVLEVGFFVGANAFLSSWPDNTIVINGDPTIFTYVLVTIGVGLRIWQIIDLWWLPDDYKIVRNIELSPDLYTTNKGDLGLGLSLKYRF